MVPIHRAYFVSDLAVAMKLPILAVAFNRLVCLNHAVLTEQSVSVTSYALWGLY
jgi:dethiobiotin synthetase